MTYNRAAHTPLTGPERLESRELPAVSFTHYPAVPNLDPATAANVRQIAAVGRDHGLRSDAFVKLGDSNTDTDDFLRPVGFFGYNPVASGLTDPNLLATANAYRAPAGGDGRDSFARNSLADFPGWRTVDILATVDAELADTRAGVALVMIGTNDVGTGTPNVLFRAQLGELVDRLVARGVVPILSTLPRNLYTPGFEPQTARFNQIIADVAAERRVPLMNLSTILDTLPVFGLKADAVHLSVSPRGGGAFGPADLIFGQNLRGFLTIQALTVVRRTAFQSSPSEIANASGLRPWTPIKPGEPIIAAGPDLGQPPVVAVSDPETGQIKTRFLAFDANFTGGVRVAVGDVTGDGVSDIITGAGPGGGPVVKAFDGATGAELFSLFAFEPEFRGGVEVAVGDADCDGAADLVIGAGAGGGPRVKVIRAADLTATADFLAFEPNFRGGVTVAVGDFGGAAGPAIAVGPGAGGGGVLKLFTAAGDVLMSRFVFEPAYRGGLTVAAGDLDGDGRAELVTGSVVNAARVLVTAIDGAELASFFADGIPAEGVRVGVVPARPGRRGLIVTGTVDPAGAVGLYDEFGNRAGRMPESDATVLLAGAYVGGG